MSAPLPLSTNPGLAPGTIVGDKYRIDGFLGAGGMGVVLSATHLELDAPVAIKIVRDDLAQNEDAVSRLLFEARAAARMRGTHVVRVLDVARLDTGAPYIVMEQLQGSDLATVLAERGAVSVPEAVSYVLQACDGLAEAHALGIIHRDLKPENLFLATTPEGVVLKILDFGISKNIGTLIRAGGRSTLTSTGLAVGSPYYMSPEQMRAAQNLDARADIWSLGAILFELLAGRCPFEAETPALLCAKVMVDDAPSLLGCSSAAPEELDAIVRRCLQKDPRARFQTVTELADALRDFTAAEAVASAHPQRLASGIDLRSASSAQPLRAPQATEGDGQSPPARKRIPAALLGVSALLVLLTVGSWHSLRRTNGGKWATARAATAEPAAQLTPSAARAPELASSPTPAASIVVSPSVTAAWPSLASAHSAHLAHLVHSAHLAPSDQRFVAAAPTVAASPSVVSPAVPVPSSLPARSKMHAAPAADPDSENPASRYGL